MTVMLTLTGYTREAYLDLVSDIRRIIPNVTLSTDVIAGFCGETEEEHQDTLLLMETVKFDRAFMFAYSARPKTPAVRRYQDDVPEATKSRRLQEIIALFQRGAIERNRALVGSRQIVLVEGINTKNEAQIKGKTDGFHVCFVAREGLNAEELTGKYIEVEITNATSQVLQAKFIRETSIIL